MERLGWITSCDRDPSCPQVWLEHSVAEIPVHVACPVCGQDVALVATEAELEARKASEVVAWPVVPPMAIGRPTVVESARTSNLGGTVTGPALPAEPGVRGDTRPDPRGRFDEPSDEGWEPVGADLGAPSSEPPPARARTPSVRRLFVELDNGDRVPLDKPTMVIGRSRACDVIIPSAKVSRQHATLTWVGDELFIEDLGSANGIWRDGHKLSRDRIFPGDVVRISDETLRFVTE